MGRRSNRYKIWKAAARVRGAQEDAAQLVIHGEITAAMMGGEPAPLGDPTATLMRSQTGGWYKRSEDGSLRRVV